MGKAKKKNMTVQRSLFFKRLRIDLRDNWTIYLMVLIPLVWLIVFCYVPMSGIQLAFKTFKAKLGIWGSPWIGFKNFERFFKSYSFGTILWNTISINVYSLVVGFPIPIVFALFLNYLRHRRLKKTVQMVSYAPYFISTVVMCGMIIIFLDKDTGAVNQLLRLLGMDGVNFMGTPAYFKDIYVWTSVWQGMGWSSVIYFAALSGISPELHEAAKCDGATKFQIIRYIDFPSILPTATIQLILSCGSILSIGFEKAFALQNDLNTSVSEIISTYVYKVGMIDNNMSYSSAIGLFNTLVNLVILVIVNKAADKMSGTSLF